MPEASVDNPYPVGTLVTDPQLLQLRQPGVEAAVNTVAPEGEGGLRHVVILAEPHSGRSSVLKQAGRRIAEERDRLVVELEGDHIPETADEFIRVLLTAIVEALAAATGPRADWYLAWKDRVYLNDRSPTAERDVLSSALLYAADPRAKVDRAILERDLTELLQIAREAGLKGIVVSIDDVSSLTEDVDLTEGLVEMFDAVGGFALLMAGLPAVAGHFQQAASKCLERCAPLNLRPFNGPHQIYTALRAPLSGDADSYLKPDDADFLQDVLRLTGGNPYEVMVVGRYLWQSCQLGEQDNYSLTPRILDRVIPHLALLTADGDALRDGAEAIERLPDEQVKKAAEMAGFARLTVRQVAVARLLGINAGDEDRFMNGDALLDGDIDEEEARVRAELEELEEAGVIQLHEDGERFSVVGGRHASVLLKYKARARIGDQASGLMFGLGFLETVGQPLALDLTETAVRAIDNAESLGYSAIASTGSIGRLSPRQAVRSLESSDDIGRLLEAEIDLNPWGREEYDRIGEILAEDDPSIGLICTSIAAGRRQIEYLEVLGLPAAVTTEDLAQEIGDAAEKWASVVAAADLSWQGCQSTVLHGETARRVLCAIQSLAAGKAVFDLFKKWREDGDDRALAAARRIAIETAATMQASGKSDAELAGELSGMLSRAGFLSSFDNDLLEEAQTALEDALRVGDAEGAVTHWNLANVRARQGEAEKALEHLNDAAKLAPNARANILFYLPGRAAADSLVEVGDEGFGPLVELQRAVIERGTGEEIDAAIVACRELGEPGVIAAAEWVANGTLEYAGSPSAPADGDSA